MSLSAELSPEERIAPLTPPPISRWTAMGLGVALVFFTVSAALSYNNQQRFAATEELASASRVLIAAVDELTSVLQTAETSHRAYLLTERSEFLASYREAINEVPNQLNELGRLAFNAEQQAAVRDLAVTALERVKSLEGTLEIHRTQGREAAQAEVASGRGQTLMQRYQREADAFNDHERDVFRQRRVDAARALRITHLSDLVAAAIGLGLASLAFVQLRREFLRRWETMQTLDEQRNLLQVTLDSIGDAVLTTDRQGRVQSLNPVAERLLSWPASTAAGRPLTDGFTIVSERSREAFENPVLRAIRDGQTVRQPQNALLIARDTTERRIDGSAAPIRTADGRVLGSVLTFRDITDRKRAEDALRRSEARLHRALSASRMMAWEIDLRADIVIRSENSAELFGLPLFGSVTEFFDLVYPDDREMVRSSLDRLIRGEGDYAIECRVRLADGRVLWVADTGVLQRNDSGEPTHVAGVLVDITELKRAESELREIDHRKDHFLATLAHELRNPLAPISNIIQAWSFVKNDPVELEQFRKTLERQVAQLTRLIDDLLDVSRISRGKIEIRSEHTNLRVILEAAIESVRPLIDSRGHDLRLSIPDPPPQVEGDVARLVQIFTNLLNNAAKYTGERGRIDVTVYTEPADNEAGGQVVVSVRDNGPGIPRAMLQHIFDMFSQVDQTLERSNGGLGIGLTLVRTLTDLHGGHVEARSDGPGTGSTFLVTLPLAAPDTRSAPNHPPMSFEENSAMPAADVLPTLKLLVVDDMRPSARTLAMMLKGIGQETDVAHDGPAALAAIDSFHPDIVLLDIAMPGMDGYEVCRRVRQREGHQPLLVALTGYGQEEDRQRAFDAGFDKHLVKPTSLEALRSLLAEVGSVT